MTAPASVEARARRYLMLFPAWMREDRGEEAVGLVLDLLPPGAERLPLRSRLDLVRAGLHARRVGTPPLWVWVDVLSAGKRNERGAVPARWRPWVWQWTAARGWAWRQTVASLALWVTPLLVLAVAGANIANPAFLPIFVTWRCTARAQGWRRLVWERNGFVAPSEGPDRLLRYTVRNGPAARILGRWAAACLAGSAASVAVGLIWHEPELRWSAALGPAVVAGLAAWFVLWVGRRSLAATRPEPQHWKVADRKGDRWALRLGVALVFAASTAFGFAAALVEFAVGVSLAVVRRRARRRGAELGRPIELWEAVPLLGPGASIPLPPEPVA